MGGGSVAAENSVVHLACARTDLTAAELTTLLDAHPKAVQERTKDGGNLPIHIVLANGDAPQSTAMVQALLMRWPGAAKERNSKPDRQLPLHVACTGVPVTVETLNVLINAYPQALSEFDGNG